MHAVLTLDLGTSATKAGLWLGDALVALARADLATAYPRPGWAEQDPADWWRSVVESCARVRDAVGPAWAEVDTIALAATRETFTLVDARLEPLGPGILWSDQRAAGFEHSLGDTDALRIRTGVIANAAAHLAKVAWVARNEPAQFQAARWILAPRDLVVARLTGEVATDETLASRTGFYALDDALLLPRAEELLGTRVPPVRPSTTILGRVRAEVANELGVPAATSVVLGAGDRACEVLGVGATAAAPMVSWGTTVNVSVPHPGPTEALPHVAAVSRGALGGFVIEAGLSASGAALGWLAELTGRDHDALLDDAAAVEPGARGVLALPWLHGARAPWWRPGTFAAFLGLTGAHGADELARALVEGVAFDAARCLELLGIEAEGLCLAGAGAGRDVWRHVLAAVTARPWLRRRHDDAASVGARLVAAAALGESLTVDACNPVVARGEPEPLDIDAYRALRPRADAAAAAVLDLLPPPGTR